MATLKREIKKLPSEQNLRLLSSLVISLANKTSSVEDKCITPWKAEQTYQKDVSFVVYNGYIYSCTVTNKDTVFTESHWMKLADNFDELSVDDVKAFLNLTPEQIQTLSSIILDAEVRLDKTWSSSKIYTDIQQCLDDSKAYTLAELGKASGASYKVVSSTGEMTEQKYIYLMSDSSGSYNLYIVEDDGSTVQIGNTTINLSDYYTKTEIDNDFLKKTDADGKYATITTVDGKVDKTSILSIMQDTDNSKVFGAKAVYDTFNQKADKTNLHEMADSSNKTKYLALDIPGTNTESGKTTRFFIVDNNTEEVGIQVWGEGGLEKDKRFYTDSVRTGQPANVQWVNTTNEGEVSGMETYIKDGEDIIDVGAFYACKNPDNNETSLNALCKTGHIKLLVPSGKTAYINDREILTLNEAGYLVLPKRSDGSTTILSSWIDAVSNLPFVAIEICNKEGKIKKFQFNYNMDTIESLRFDGTNWSSNGIFVLNKIPNVPKTRIDLPNISPEFATGYIEFEVYNGVCYMAMFNLAFVNASTGNLVVNIPGVPKRKSDGWHTITNVSSLKPLVVNIGANGGAIEFYAAREIGTSYYGTFSYPVAES